MGKYETLVKYVKDKLVGYDEEINLCLKYLNEYRSGLTDFIEGRISDAIDDFCCDNDLHDDFYNVEEVFNRSYEDLFYDAIDNTICFEWCQNCEDEVILVNYFAPQICPNCKKVILPCNICEKRVSNCPLADLKKYVEETNNEIVFEDEILRVNGKYLKSLPDVDDTNVYIGKKIFWLDPCFLRKEYHTSDWKEIADVKGDIVICTDDTEVLLDECYW
jgi:hypothetical protein